MFPRFLILLLGALVFWPSSRACAADQPGDLLNDLFAPASTNQLVFATNGLPHALPAFNDDYKFPEQRRTAPVSTEWREADSILLVVLLSVGAWLFHARRDHRWLWLPLGIGLAWFGFLRHGCICPIGAIGNVTAALVHPERTEISRFTILAFFVPLAFALLFGRIFCGAVCPMGAVQRLLGWRSRPVSPKVDRVLRWGGWLLLLLAVGSAANSLALPICKFDPFVTLFRHSGTSEMWLFTIAGLLVCVRVDHPYCRWICPYAKLLGALASLCIFGRRIDPQSCRQCGNCETGCPVGALRENRIKLFDCVACGRCTEACPRQAIR